MTILRAGTREAERYYKEMQERLSKYGLNRDEQKPALEFEICEGRSEAKRRGNRDVDFLGFTFYCSKERNQKVLCKTKDGGQTAV